MLSPAALTRKMLLRRAATMSWVAVLGLGAGVTAGCPFPDRFSCTAPADCDVMPNGACAGGFCAYPDASCSSGFAFLDAAAEGCVDGDPSDSSETGDAGTIDDPSLTHR